MALEKKRSERLNLDMKLKRLIVWNNQRNQTESQNFRIYSFCTLKNVVLSTQTITQCKARNTKINNHHRQCIVINVVQTIRICFAFVSLSRFFRSYFMLFHIRQNYSNITQTSSHLFPPVPFVLLLFQR